jgi:hypothetical protein
MPIAPLASVDARILRGEGCTAIDGAALAAASAKELIRQRVRRGGDEEVYEDDADMPSDHRAKHPHSFPATD